MGAYVQPRPPQKGGICTLSLTASGASLFSLEGLATGRDWWGGSEGLDTHGWRMGSLVPRQAGREGAFPSADCIW